MHDHPDPDDAGGYLNPVQDSLSVVLYGMQYDSYGTLSDPEHSKLLPADQT